MTNPPHELTIKITAENYSHTLTDENGRVIWQQTSTMYSAGSSSHLSGEEIFDCEELNDLGYDDLQESIDDLNSGPFGVAGSLFRINKD